jgi:glycerol uptake facilitator-like aquaporin
MEKYHGNDNKLAICLSEFLGTMTISLALCLTWTASMIIASVDATTLKVTLAPSVYYLYVGAGVCLYSVFYLFAPISGGHFNPAVTIAVYISLAFNAHNLVIATMMILA